MSSIEVYGRLPARALSYDVQQIGKTIAASKVRVTWKFVFEGNTEDHMVALVHSTVSGRKQIFVDGQVYHEETEATIGEWKYTFTMRKHRIDLIISGYPGSEDYYGLHIEGMSFKTLPQTTMDRVREARRREIAAQEEKAQRLSEQAAARDGAGSSQQAFAAMAEAGDKTSSSSKVSSRRARAASNHSAKLGKPSTAAKGGSEFDPFAEPEAAAPAPAPTPAPAASSSFDPFGEVPAAPSESPAAASHTSAAPTTSDPFDFGADAGATAGATSHTSPEDDLAMLNFTAPAQPAGDGGAFGNTPSNASTGAASAASSANGKPLYDLDDLTGVRKMGGGSGASTPKKGAPSMAEMARIQAATGGKKPVMMSSAASTPSGGQQPQQGGGYFAQQHQQQRQPQYGAYQQQQPNQFQQQAPPGQFQQQPPQQQQQQQAQQGGQYDPFAGF